MLCVPDEDGIPAESTLLRDYFGMHRFEWPDDDGVEFHIGYGDWIRLLRANDFELDGVEGAQEVAVGDVQRSFSIYRQPFRREVGSSSRKGS